METLEPLSNLTSLTELMVSRCWNLGGEGIWSLLAQGRLRILRVFETPKFFTSSEPPNFPRSCKLESVTTDDPTGFLVAPICSLLSSSLTCLHYNYKVEHFTKEQEEALQRLTSLQELQFAGSHKLQCLPSGLHRLPNLKTLRICGCRTFRSLPKDGLPCSLQNLTIWDCPAFESLPMYRLPSSLQNLQIFMCHAFKSIPKDSLPSSLQELTIRGCPALKSLSKDSLPSSLRVLDVGANNNEELMRQCRKLKGTIPIIRG